jgi:biotin-(acetyl-CoA carboxylase) ligase
VTSAPQPILSPIVCLALYNSLQSTSPSGYWSIKAPNDIYIAQNKVAGLLIENVSIGSANRLIVGLGMNVSRHPKIENAGDLEKNMNHSVSDKEWSGFLNEFWKNLNQAIDEIKQTSLTDPQRSALRDALNRYSGLNEKYQAVLPDGGLRLKDRIIFWHEL